MPGVAFAPDERQAAILEEAAVVGEAMARANSYVKRFEGARLWPDKYWEKSLFLTDTDQDLDTHTQVDHRIHAVQVYQELHLVQDTPEVLNLQHNPADHLALVVPVLPIQQDPAYHSIHPNH